jgi:cytosine/adenosine deaminase-related metal-dependent hydrolase
VSAVTPGLVCGHHHLYSALARGMPAPPVTPTSFLSILEQVWWRLDAALDLEMLRWSAMLGALEALECGTTAIVDHHESPGAIEGSLSVIADACAEVGVRVVCAYGVTDRWSDDGTPAPQFSASNWDEAPKRMTSAARRGLDECRRFIDDGGRGMVGVHAGFTCSTETLESAAGLAADLGVGVHIHVAEGTIDGRAADRLLPLANEHWLLVHGVHLPDGTELPGSLAHNPRSNMNNSVGYARPTRFPNRVVLGTDGIGADMLEEFRLAYARLREHDVDESPDTAWRWLENGWQLVPEARDDRVTWTYEHADSPWHVAFSPGIRATDVVRGDGEVLLRGGWATRVDRNEVRAKAAEQAARLFERL